MLKVQNTIFKGLRGLFLCVYKCMCWDWGNFHSVMLSDTPSRDVTFQYVDIKNVSATMAYLEFKCMGRVVE